MRAITVLSTILLLWLSTIKVSSGSNHHLSGHGDVFEDAILEHLRDVRSDEEADNVYYNDEDSKGEYDEGSEPDLSRDELLRVLDVIKKEARKRRTRLQHENEEVEATTDEVVTTASPEATTKTTLEPAEEEHKKDIIVHKTQTNKKEADTENQKQARPENNQVASVEEDSGSLDRENKRIESTNLREILSKDKSSGGVSQAATTPSGPKHAHMKQQHIVSTKENKAGLDRVSFIAVVAGCCVAAIAGLGLAAYCWYKLRVENKDDAEDPKPVKKSKSSKKKNKDADTKEEKPLSKDEEMNVNAEYYNYQHAKNQMKQMGQTESINGQFNGNESSDDEEDEDTVYECPGPGAPGDMKVVNPMFSDGESRHSDKVSHDGSPSPPMEISGNTNNNN